MTQNYKVLGQIFPSSNTLTNVYVTGANTSAVINSIYICNQDSTSANVEIIVRPIDEALSNKHYVLYGEEVDAAATYPLNLAITMGANTILAANTTTGANISYSAFGIEIT
jgi:hypothetical protein